MNHNQFRLVAAITGAIAMLAYIRNFTELSNTSRYSMIFWSDFFFTLFIIYLISGIFTYIMIFLGSIFVYVLTEYLNFLTKRMLRLHQKIESLMHHRMGNLLSSNGVYLQQHFFLQQYCAFSNYLLEVFSPNVTFLYSILIYFLICANAYICYRLVFVNRTYFENYFSWIGFTLS